MKRTCMTCGREYKAPPTQRPKYCSRTCYAGREVIPFAGFEDGFAAAGEDECWPWLKATRDGYGAVYRHPSLGPPIVARAHRVAWERANGRPVPPGMFVCHRCDNPPCVNPAHLFIAPPAGNTADMVAKGRANNATKGRPGEAHPQAKITEDIARHTRDSTEPTSQLMKTFGISRSLVKGIRRRENWSHLK